MATKKILIGNIKGPQGTSVDLVTNDAFTEEDDYSTSRLVIMKSNGENDFVDIRVRNGVQGPQGVQGPEGPQGPAGADGKTMYRHKVTLFTEDELEHLGAYITFELILSRDVTINHDYLISYFGNNEQSLLSYYYDSYNNWTKYGLIVRYNAISKTYQFNGYWRDDLDGKTDFSADTTYLILDRIEEA